MTTSAPDNGPIFDAAFRASLRQLFAWRRDVRHFRRDPVPPALIDTIIEIACSAPSVGNSQPWRYVLVETEQLRRAVMRSFESANAAALSGYDGSRGDMYARMKLEGLGEAPVHIAVFCDEGVSTGHGLGRQTMPETLRYSVVGAIQTLWLAARAEGLGVGWVSIIEPKEVVQALNVPPDWSLIAYLCVGWPTEPDETPELERVGWQERQPSDLHIFRR